MEEASHCACPAFPISNMAKWDVMLSRGSKGRTMTMNKIETIDSRLSLSFRIKI